MGIVWKDIFTLHFTSFIAYVALVPLLLFATRGRRAIRYLVLLASLVFFGFLQWSCPRPEGLFDFILIGPWDPNEKLPPIIKLSVVIIGALLFGRYYCGYICPPGAVQELLHRSQTAIRVPPKADRILRYGKFVMLAAAILLPLLFGVRVMKHVGPFRVIFNLDGETHLIVLLGVVLLASVFIGRPYCRYLCPIGALLGLVQKFASLVKVRIRKDATCNACQQAQSVCPTLAVACSKPKSDCTLNINDVECVSCMECLPVCKTGCLQYGGRKESAKGRKEP